MKKEIKAVIVRKHTEKDANGFSHREVRKPYTDYDEAVKDLADYAAVLIRNVELDFLTYTQDWIVGTRECDNMQIIAKIVKDPQKIAELYD